MDSLLLQPPLLFGYSAVVAQLVPLPPLLAVVLAHGGDGDAAVAVGGVIVANSAQRKDIAVGESCVREALLLLEVYVVLAQSLGAIDVRDLSVGRWMKTEKRSDRRLGIKMQSSSDWIVKLMLHEFEPQDETEVESVVQWRLHVIQGLK